MKSCTLLVTALLTCITLLSLIDIASATPIAFTEKFLAGEEKFILYESDKAEFSFDLGGIGGEARLLRLLEENNCTTTIFHSILLILDIN